MLSVIRNVAGSSKSIERESQIVYDYLHQRASTELPQGFIKNFQSLFAQGKYNDSSVAKALEKIIFSGLSQQQFDNFFSHCFYLILNCWAIQTDSLVYLSELLAILEIINNSRSYDRRRKQLFKLIQGYQQSASYYQLVIVTSIIKPQAMVETTMLGGVATNETSDSKVDLNTIIHNYLVRYTYLYSYFCPQESDLEQLQQSIATLETQRRQEFEFKLSKYIIYRFRLKQMARMKLLSKGAGKIITKAENPSLLSEKAFNKALQQYQGKLEHQQTLLERSQRFIVDNQRRNSYQVFKQDLYHFLVDNLKVRQPGYGFKGKLKRKLNNIFAQSDAKPLNNTLILQTCRQLFSFLIVDAQGAHNPQYFAELVANLGTAQVMQILIKITLICPEAKIDLTKKLAAIAIYYQHHNLQDTAWVLKILEHCLIAFAIYFGDVDVSIASKSVLSSKK